MTCLFGLETDGTPWLVFCRSKRCFEERCPNVLTWETDAHVLWWELRPDSFVHTAAQISQPAKKRAKDECIRKTICHHIRATGLFVALYHCLVLTLLYYNKPEENYSFVFNTSHCSAHFSLIFSSLAHHKPLTWTINAKTGHSKNLFVWVF